MNHKIIFNVPNEKYPTEVSITQEQLEILEPELNKKRIVKINSSYYNTAYIVKIIPDSDANRLNESSLPQLEETAQTINNQRGIESVKKLKEELIKKKVI